MESRTITVGNMTSECWTVQFRGLEACNDCEHKDTDECGGKEIIKTGKNAKGHEVPLGKEVKTK